MYKSKKNKKPPCINKLNKTKKNLGCSPNVNNNKNYTCYNNKSLIYLKNLWNTRHPDLFINTNNNKLIWNYLKNYMNHICKNEKCWLKQNFSKNKLTDELKNYTFLPETPKSWKKNKNEWLNSLDIERVMKQYEKKYSNFEFLGPSPINFDNKISENNCVWNELCNFNLSNKILKGVNKIGIIFNTDPHYLSGSHWISMFINIKEKYILFFDSNGTNPPKEVKNLINKIKKQGKILKINFKVLINKKNHQKENSECGMYSLHTIIGLLENYHDINFYLNNNIPDKNMEKLRKIYFN